MPPPARSGNAAAATDRAVSTAAIDHRHAVLARRQDERTLVYLHAAQKWSALDSPIALLLAFLLTFATWLAAAPNGTKVYTQSGWQAITGAFTVADFVGDGVLGKERALNAERAWSIWLLFTWSV